MTEDEAKRVLLVRAVEEEDEAGDLLTRQDRAQANEAGRAALSASGGKGDELFLVRRAEFATGRLASRNPAIAQALARTAWPHWIGWAMPLAAFVFGAALNELGNGRRLDLLALPLLGMLAWNALVYFWMLATIIPRSRRAGPSGLAKWLEKAAYIGRRAYDRATTMARALSRFVSDWSGASAPLAAARSARILHLSAAAFALGVVAGIYFRALGIEYRAGWESTFLRPDAVHTVLSVALGPASALTGVPIPDAEGIAAIRWTSAETGAQTGGANAANWIYLITATVAGFIVAPRLILAGLAAMRAWRKARRFALPGREAFYYRRLLRGARGQDATVRVTPYAHHPGDTAKSALTKAVQDALGDGAALRFDAPVEYGAEDRWLEAAQFDAGDDHHLILFTLSATPEHENHGFFAGRVREMLARRHPGTLVGAIVDESAFRERFAGQSASAARIETRGEAWDDVLARAGVPALKLDLSDLDGTQAEQLEALLTGKLARKIAA